MNRLRVFLLAGAVTVLATGAFAGLPGCISASSQDTAVPKPVQQMVLSEINIQAGTGEGSLGAGWHEAEGAPGDQVRWTSKQAEFTLPVPPNVANAFLQIVVQSNVEYFEDKEISVSVEVNGRALEPLAITLSGSVVLRFDLPQQVLAEKSLDVIITTSKTFVPAKFTQSADTRELGIQVRRISLIGG